MENDDTIGNELHLASGISITLGCCDVDPAEIAGSGSVVWAGGNIRQNPQFCDPVDCTLAPATLGVYELDVNSPCADAPGCGQIGALPVGCGATAVEAASWGAIKASFNQTAP